jgi:MFS family permease
MTQAADVTFATRRAEDVRLVAGVSAAHFVSHYYILVLPPLFVFLRQEYGVSYTELALALTVFNVVSAVLQTPAGFLVDRINPRTVLIAGLLLGAVGLTIAASVNSYWWLVAMFGVMGIGNTVYHPADYALLSRHVAPERVSQAYSVHTFAGLLGGAAAPGTVLFMHSLFGWRGALLGAAILGFVVSITLLFQRDVAAGPSAVKPQEKKDDAQDNSWRLLLSPPILMSLLFFMLLAFGNFGLQTFLVVAVGALHGTSPATANTALSAHLAFGAAGVLLGGWIAGRTTRHAIVAALCLVVMALSALLVGLVDLGPWLLVLVLSISGLATGCIMPSRDMIVREVTPPGSFGKVFGFVTNGFNVAGIISPLVFGALMDHGEAQLVFFLLAACSLTAMVTIVSVPRRPALAGASHG